jgi:hypothetical protein
LRERLFFSFIFILMLLSACSTQQATQPFIVPNAQPAAQAAQPSQGEPAAQEVQPSPADECEFDYDCGFGKRCDYPLCKPCPQVGQCHCPKICMVVTKEGELRDVQK